MKAVVTLSSKNQIVIPKAARKKLAIEPGDQLILDVEKDTLILKAKPKSYTKHLRGLHRVEKGSVQECGNFVAFPSCKV